MANPMIDIDEDFSVRAHKIEALEVQGATMIVHLDDGHSKLNEARSHQDAREMRNRIAAAVHQADVKSLVSDEICTTTSSFSGNASTNALMAEAHAEDARVSIKGMTRQASVNRIADVLRYEFGDCLGSPGFMEDLWVALQVIYGPSGAADFISECQNPRQH
ncbi:hypothetical protein [Cedecea sp. NFIX57]|uniref:hypothetical protein n=1 Tax=Cedecea sp. NFIX57 TaxID=1566286 RepID=UPI000A0EC1F3|nr:hypothetical protein [Cedecea sp. NFIX57]SMG61927.1 hypothetical protein SAMN03159353_10798 [Cedecea sp. NFIX57]